MLSILIPSYNVDLTSLVGRLLKQARLLSVPFEIVVMDDASTDAKVRDVNGQLSTEEEVEYIQQSVNNGRSKIRNLLVERARYPYLLLMDCDAGVVRESFLATYVDYLNAHPELPSRFVISGGLCYRSEKPARDRRLRWKYGHKRESRPALERNQHPYQSFTPFNILTTKETFTDNGFDETFSSYGYEDTLWGYQLQQKQIPLIHVDNPLYHDGLDTNVTYLQKTRQAVENLYRLMREERLPEEFRNDSRLLRSFSFFQKKGMLLMGDMLYYLLHQLLCLILRFVPWLRFLDAYKLLLLTHLSRAKQHTT